MNVYMDMGNVYFFFLIWDIFFLEFLILIVIFRVFMIMC